MKSSILFLFFSMIIFSSINCLIIKPITVLENKLNIVTLSNDWNFILLRNSNNPNASNRMLIEIMFSHPSKYCITFNKYNDEKIIMDENKLSPNYTLNQTGIILNEKNDVGKSKLILNITKASIEDSKDIILYFQRNKSYKTGTEDKVMIRYLSNDSNDKYFIKNTTIELVKDKNILNISFGGISTNENENENLPDLSANYAIDIFEKEALEKNIQNLYSYALYNDKRISLYHKELKIKGKIANSNYIRINPKLKTKKELVLLIKVIVENSTGILQYEAATFKVTGGDSEEEIDTEKNIKENKLILIIVIGLYTGSVILTFIIVFIYFAIRKKNEAKFKKGAEEYDYKNIGEIKTLSEDE